MNQKWFRRNAIQIPTKRDEIMNVSRERTCMRIGTPIKSVGAESQNGRPKPHYDDENIDNRVVVTGAVVVTRAVVVTGEFIDNTVVEAGSAEVMLEVAARKSNRRPPLHHHQRRL